MTRDELQKLRDLLWKFYNETRQPVTVRKVAVEVEERIPIAH